jgi:DNA polymerase III subunit beta
MTTKGKAKDQGTPSAPATTTLTVERDALTDAVSWAVRALPARPTSPILAGMRFTHDGSRLTVATFDYEVSAAATIDAQGDPCDLLLAGRLLAEITKALPPYPVTFTADGTRVTITCGSAKFQLLMLPLEEYPALPDLGEVTGTVGADALAAMVTRTAPAASHDDTLPAITGVQMTFTGAGVTAIATDRYRLAVTELPAAAWTPKNPGMDEIVLLVPAKVLSDAVRGMTGGETIEVHAAESMIGLAGNDRWFTTRLLSGEYPKARNLIPSEFSATADLPVTEVMEAVRRIALILDTRTKLPIHLEFAGGQLKLTAGAGDEATGEEVVGGEIRYEGADMSLAFNPAYFLDGLAPLAGRTARLHLVTEIKPALLAGWDPEKETLDEDYQYVIMPIRSAG